jgi:protein-tyrosine phosphatase
MTATQIIGGLYVGDIDDVREGDTSKFDRVVGVCQDDCSDNVGVPYEHFCLADSPDDVRGHNPGEFSHELVHDAIDSVVAARIQRETVLVHCHVGRSRSATVAIAAMSVVEGMTWDEAYNRAKEQRPLINPNKELVEAGRAYVEDHQ